MGRLTVSKTHMKEATFVVRLWSDNGVEAEASWRGHIEHIQTGKKEYFQGFDHLNEIVRQFTFDRRQHPGRREKHKK